MATQTETTFQRWQVGDVRVTKIVESETLFDIPGSFPGASMEEVQTMDWLRPHFCTSDWQGRMSMHALVVETPDHTIMVDTCVGNDRDRADFVNLTNMQTAFMQDFEAAGFSREKIDVVLCTHLHFDHVGWNTMKQGDGWVPTFPNARYLFERTEYAHWLAAQQNHDVVGFDKVQNLTFIDSVKPVIEAGLADLVDPTHQVCKEVRLVPTPGHSPGHVCVHIASQGQQGYITGDMVHHPSQFFDAAWSMSSVDFDTGMATETRKSFYGEVADQPVLVIGTHFAGATAGWLRRDGDRYRFDAQE